MEKTSDWELKMSLTSEISVIIPTYNRPGWLSQSLESVLNQTLLPMEIIVINDGSSSDEAQKIAEKYPGVQYFWQENQGPGAARNYGFQLSKGRFIQFLDDDDWLGPNALSEKMKLLQNNPGVDLVYSDLYVTDMTGKIISQFFKSFTRPLPQGDIYPILVQRNLFPPISLLWRRDIFERAGGFPCRYGHEDWELFLKTAEFSKFGVVDRPLGYYRMHHGSLTEVFNSMFDGKLVFQESITKSPRFSELSINLRRKLLCKYALEQWGWGDQVIAKRFINEAYNLDKQAVLPILVKMWMLLGRQISRSLIYGRWYLMTKKRMM